MTEVSCQLMWLVYLKADDCNSYAFEGFAMMRNDQAMRNDSIRPSHGSAVYVRNDVTVLKFYSYNSKELELTYIDSQHELTK